MSFVLVQAQHHSIKTHHNACSATAEQNLPNIETMTAHTGPALNWYALFGKLPSSTSSFTTTNPLAHSTNALSRNRKRVFSEDFSVLHQDDYGLIQWGR